MGHGIINGMAAYAADDGIGWHGIGLPIDPDRATDPQYLAEVARCNFRVDLRDIFDADGNRIPGYKATTKDTTDEVFGIVSDSRYHVAHRQPVDVIGATVNDLVKHNLKPSHICALDGGAKIVISCKVGDFSMVAGMEDKHDVYANLVTGYDGDTGTSLMVSIWRAVCKNTITASINECKETGRIRTIRASTRLQETTLPQLLANLDQIVSKQQRTFDALANRAMSEADVLRTFADVLEINVADLNRADPKTGKPVVSTKARNMLDAMVLSYKNAPGAMPGTAYGVLQGVTHYATHVATVRDTSGDGSDAARVKSNLFGNAAHVKRRALEMLTQAVAA